MTARKKGARKSAGTINKNARKQMEALEPKSPKKPKIGKSHVFTGWPK